VEKQSFITRKIYKEKCIKCLTYYSTLGLFLQLLMIFSNYFLQNTLKFWLDRGVDGFSVISAPYIFEDKKLRNEPRSYALGATPRDYSYLNHIYTVNLKPTYELLRNFKIRMDQYADEFNEDEKVNKVILFCQTYMLCTY